MAFKLTIHNKRNYLLLEIDSSYDGLLTGFKIRDGLSYDLKFLANGADTRFYRENSYYIKSGKNWIRTSTGYLNWTTRDQIQLTFKIVNTDLTKGIFLTPTLRCPLPRNVVIWEYIDSDMESDVQVFVEFLNSIYGKTQLVEPL
jgi:hypothetical protein